MVGARVRVMIRVRGYQEYVTRTFSFPPLFLSLSLAILSSLSFYPLSYPVLSLSLSPVSTGRVRYDELPCKSKEHVDEARTIEVRTPRYRPCFLLSQHNRCVLTSSPFRDSGASAHSGAQR